MDVSNTIERSIAVRQTLEQYFSVGFANDLIQNHFEPCYSKCGPQTSCISIHWRLVRNTESQVLPQTY